MGGAIKYLGYYVPVEDAQEGRAGVPAARDKMDYIITCLNRAGLDVQVVTAAPTSGARTSPGREVSLDGRNTLKSFRSLGYGGIVRRALRSAHSFLTVFLYLVLHVRRGEDVLVYHSLGYARSVLLAQRVRSFRLVLEVEELYADVTGRVRDRRLEHHVFERAAAFIFPTEVLDTYVNPFGKPSTVVHGVYTARPRVAERASDGRIHVVYAGTFDPRKGGAVAAAAAEYLDERYHVHILGFGSARHRSNLVELVDRVSEMTRCGLTFDGLLAGDRYSDFLQTCDIGLSTQRTDAAFNETSFPSKVLSYLSHGLRVVSARLRVLEESRVGDMLYFYDGDSPEAVARTIMSIDMDDSHDSRSRLAELDREFVTSLKGILS